MVNRPYTSRFVSALWRFGLLVGACGVSLAQPSVTGKIGGISGFSPQLTLNLMLTNSGSSPATSIDLTAITFKVLNGTGSVAFAAPAPAFPLAIPGLGAGASETVPVNVRLTGVVQRFSITESGTLTDGSNDTFSFSIGQTVIPPVAIKTLSLSTGTLTYLPQNVNTTSAAQSVTISSIGTAAVNLSPIAAPSGDYSISANTCGATLAAGANCSVSITFTPTSTGTRTGALTISDDAAGSPQAVTLTGTGQTKMIGVTSLVTYTGQDVNTTSAAQAVTVSNMGTAALNLNPITSPTGDYAISANTCGATLASGSTCSVSITFKPTATGTRTGTLTVLSDATNSPQSASLTGIGQTQFLTLTTNLLTYPAQLTNTTSAAQSVTISSTGTATVHLSPIAAPTGDYAISVNTCGATLAAGTNCSVSVTFTPTVTGTRTSALNVTGDATNGPFPVSLTGLGITKLLSLSTNLLTYAAQNVSTTSAAQSVTISNIGTATVNLNAIAAPTGDYGISANTCGATLASGATCSVSITFTPTSTGTRTGTLTVTSDATTSPQTVNLTGSGQVNSKTISLSTSTLTFNGQNLSITSAAQSVTVSSIGTATVNLSPITAPTGDYAISANTCPATLAPGSNCSVSITFTPTATGTRTGTLSVADDATGSPQTVNLTGLGQTQLLTLSTNLLTYPAQNVSSTSPAQSVTISNTGTATLTLIAIPTPTGDYSISANTCGGTLSAGANCSVSITFTPTAIGTRTGTLTITSNATNGPFTVNLTGVGQTKLLTFSSNLLTFPGQLLNTTSAAQSVTISSTGNTAVNLNPIAAPTGNFAISADTCPAILAAGTNCSVSITFTPTVGGTNGGALTITDDATGSPQTVSLTGFGQTKLLGFGGITTLTYAAQNLNTTSAPQSVTLFSTGNTTVNLNAIAAPTGDYAVNSTTCGATLAAGATCSISVTFTPTAGGTRTGTLTVTGDATNSPQSINLTGTGQSGLKTISQNFTSFTYQAQNVGTTSAQQTVSFTSTGNTTVNITSATLSGTNPGDYAISLNNCGATLPVGNGCTVGVTFTPLSNGLRTASLLLTDDATGSPQTVTLSGMGQAATQTLTFSPTALVFSPLNVGVGTGNSVSVLNAGTATVTFSSVAIDPASANPGDFSITQSACTTLPTGNNCNVQVIFKPTAAGTRTAAVQFVDSASGSPQSVTVVGVGIPLVSAVSFSNLSLTFGPQNVGTTSNPQSTSLNVTGSTNVNVSSVVIGGTNPSDFAISFNNCTGSISNACNTNIKFTPGAIGNRTATLTFTDDSQGSPHVINLLGTGLAVSQTLSFNPGVLTFGAVNVGASVVATLGIFNSGDADVHFTNAATSDPQYVITLNNCSTVSPGNQCALQVTFTPAAAGVQAATLSLTDDATGSPQSIPLDGTGEAQTQTISISPVIENFGVQTVGFSSGSFSVGASNTGDAPLTFSNVQVTGPNAADFSISFSGCALGGSGISAGNSCSVLMNFTPSASGLRTAVLQFTDSGVGSPHSVALSGYGQDVVKTLRLSSPAIVFPAEPIATPFCCSSVQANNTGDAPLNFSSVVVTGGNAGDFSTGTSNCTTNILPGNASSVSVQFTPTAAGVRQSTLQFSDDAAGSPHSVVLTGIGNSAVQALSPSQSNVNFGSQILSTVSSNNAVFMNNASGSSVTISTVTLTGANAGDFAILPGSTCAGATLVSNANCSVNFNFTPSALGIRLASLQFTDTGAGSPQLVGLAGTGIATSKVLSIVPMAISVGPSNIGTPIDSSKLNVKNTGTTTVTFTGVSLSGPNAADFTLQSGACTGSLAPLSACLVGVTFTSSTASTETAALQIQSDATGSPQVLNLTGIGQNIFKGVVVETPALAFSAQTVNTTSNSQSVTVRTTGTASVTFAAPTIIGTDFTISSPGCSGQFSAGNSCNVGITFTPAAAGVRTATLQINSDAPGSPATANLTGVGQASVKSISTAQPALVFPAQNVNTTSSPQQVVLKNTGTVAVTFAAASIVGSDFAIQANGCNSTLVPTSTCAISVTFTPQTAALETATLQINSDAVGSPLAVSLTGLGQAVIKSVSAAPQALDFAPLNIGTTSNTQQVVLRNTGTGTVTFSAPTFIGSDFSIQSNGCSTTLPINASCGISIVFTPSTAAVETATLQINSDAVGSPISIALAGLGQNVVKVLSIPGSLTFSAQTVGTTSSSQQIVVRNTGTATTTVSNVALAGANPGDFAISSQGCATLPAGSTCGISITFNPTATGSRTASLQISSDGVGSPQSVALSGTGQ